MESNMSTSTGIELSQNIRRNIEELKHVCEGVDEVTASRSPEGRWSPKEILSHLWGPEGSGHLSILEAFLDRDAPTIDIQTENPFLSQERSRMRFAQILAEVEKEYDRISRFAAGLSGKELDRKGRFPMLKDSPYGEFVTLESWIGLLGGFSDSHLQFHINHMREVLQGLDDQEKGEGAMAAETKQEGKIDMQAAMEIYREKAKLTAPHKMLASLVGSWTTKTTAWMGPDQPAMESTGTCEQTMLLGGRYLRQEYSGEMMGDTFTGINLIGYDNHTKKYVSTWIDSMSTGIYYFEGTASEDGRVITQESSLDDPVRGPIMWRSVTTIIDENNMKYEMYITPKGGAEEKVMVMVVTRK